MPRWTQDDLEAYEQRMRNTTIVERLAERTISVSVPCPVCLSAPHLPGCPKSPKITPPTKPKTTPKPPLNKTEQRFLTILQGRFPLVRSQALRLLLANRCTYLPDFFIPATLTFYEVKGPFMREDGWIKLKMAATTYREFKFVLARWKNGMWTETDIPI